MADASETCPRVLVVEDDADQRQLLCEALSIHYRQGSGEGAPVVGVADGRQCLALDLSQFDVILMDYQLPDVSGLTLLEKVAAQADVPVVFVTGENDSQTASEAIRRGAQDYVVKLGDYLFALPALVQKAMSQYRVKRENLRLQQELQGAMRELQHKNRQLEESMARLETLATTDHLTGLANRHRFAELLDRGFGEAVRYGFDLTCCMCDLDHYKQLNDTLGHQVGDELLVRTARIIQSGLRGSDVAARYGGDEFVLLLPHTTVEGALPVCERIRQQVSEAARMYGGANPPVTVSIGVASLAADRPKSADALVALADRALYAAKDHGKDRTATSSQAHELAPAAR